MELNEAKQILKENGYITESLSKYIFKESDYPWLKKFIKEYDVWLEFDWYGKTRRCYVNDYDEVNDIVIFSSASDIIEDNKFEGLKDLLSVDGNLTANSDDVDEFKKHNNITTVDEILKLIKDNGIDPDVIIKALKGEK